MTRDQEIAKAIAKSLTERTAPTLKRRPLISSDSCPICGYVRAPRQLCACQLPVPDDQENP